MDFEVNKKIGAKSSCTFINNPDIFGNPKKYYALKVRKPAFMF